MLRKLRFRRGSHFLSQSRRQECDVISEESRTYFKLTGIMEDIKTLKGQGQRPKAESKVKVTTYKVILLAFVVRH